MRNPLLDLEFLRKLDLIRNKATYAKIILLTWDENPVYEIQGKITAGSINIDGNSAIRRTCSLTMISPDVDITNTYWALKNKFKLEVGVENEIDSQYPDIIWFKQGTYVFTSLNMNVQSSNFTISLSGKDKMCLLNGEVGGSINASTDFGKLEEYETLDNGEIVRNIIDIPIVDIIKNAVHAFAGEPLSNIILNDIDNYGLELLEYRCDSPMYMPRYETTGEVSNMTLDGNQEYFLNENKTILLKEIPVYYDRTQNLSIQPTIVYKTVEDAKNNINTYNIIKVSFGETAGYRRTELTYPGELVANVGESLTSILDKIKNMFSDFEYFYDVDGRFIFQKKKTYINTSFNNLKTDENKTYAEDAMYTSSVAYTFENGILLSAFTDAPQILNIKNDFSIWGKRKSVGGAELPVHMRYAIDFKPTYYKPLRFDENGNQLLDNKAYVSFEYREYKKIDLTENTFIPYIYYIQNLNGTYQLANNYSKDIIYYEAIKNKEDDNLIYVDWRELIYQMALDYFKYNHIKDNFTQLIAAANPKHYPTGITGYETYYTDMQGFWRQLYFPAIKDYSLISESEKKQAARAILLANNEEITDETIANVSQEEIINYYKQDYNDDCYNINISKYPETLNFWFDFMSVDGEFAKYAISAIGNRPKAINNDKITGIYFQETPSVLFLTEQDYEKLHNNREDYNDMTGYTFIQLTSSMENYFTISAQGKSAKDELDNLLYQHTYATEAVNLTAVPIYYLQPNTRIFVKDDNTGINGEFIVSKITVPLQYNGTTAITTTRAVERIY